MKQVSITLMSFSISLPTKCMSLYSETCMIQPRLTDLNLAELNYYPFIISPDKCYGSCKVADDLSTNYVLQVKQNM